MKSSGSETCLKRDSPTLNTDWHVKENRIRSLGRAPLRSIPMTLFMLWMIGNEIHLFSIVVTVMSILQPIKAIMSLASHFNTYEHDAELQPAVRAAKWNFALFNLIALSVVVLKCMWMGLIPITQYEWLNKTPVPYTCNLISD